VEVKIAGDFERGLLREEGAIQFRSSHRSQSVIIENAHRLGGDIRVDDSTLSSKRQKRLKLGRQALALLNQVCRLLGDNSETTGPHGFLA
jgi:hypothetical protein